MAGSTVCLGLPYQKFKLKSTIKTQRSPRTCHVAFTAILQKLKKSCSDAVGRKIFQDINTDVE